MNVRWLLLFLLFAVLLSFKQRWRHVGFSLIAVLVLLLIVLQFRSTQNQVVIPSRPTVSVSRSLTSIDSTSVELQNWVISGNGAPWRLQGLLVNHAQREIKAVTLQLERLDCPKEATLAANCSVVLRDTHTLRMTLPAGQQRQVDESIWSHNTPPRVRYQARDSVKIVSVN